MYQQRILKHIISKEGDHKRTEACTDKYQHKQVNRQYLAAKFIGRGPV